MPRGGMLTVSGENLCLPADNNQGLPGGDYVRICFRDEGCGIAPENVGKIFDPYFTTRKDGTGLGLASTYSIIKKHDGQISVCSEPEKGTTFTIILPSIGEEFPENVVTEQMPGTDHPSKKILVMDDDEMVRELASITLKHLGYMITTCRSGTEAISLYRSAREEGTPFDLVIMDLTIPGGMGGVEAARRILDLDPDARLIVSSGYSDDPVMANFIDYGFCASIEKPYKIEDVSRVLLSVQQDRS